MDTKEVMEVTRTVQGNSNLLTYQFDDLFSYGNNHQVLVFPVRGPSLRYGDWSSDNRYIPVSKQIPRMSAARQNTGIVQHSELTPARPSPTLPANYSTDLNHKDVSYVGHQTTRQFQNGN